MDKMRKIIFGLIVIVIILLVICLLYIKNMDNIVEEESYNYIELETEISKVKDYVDFFTVERCIQEYFNYINEKKYNEVYYLLDDEYIKENNITEQNVKEFVNKVDGTIEFKAMDMNVVQNSNYSTFAIYGIVSEYNSRGEEIYIILDLDLYNRTYSVTPMLDKQFSNVNDININVKEKPININESNKYDYYMISEEEICRKHMEHYIYNAIYYPEKAYEMIESKYREERFETLDSYKKYISYKYNKLIDTTIVKYLVKYGETEKQYFIIDEYNNYYCFTEENVMQYNIILDNYTIKTSEFIDTYLKASDQEKVITNIDIFIKMINTKDYDNAYNLLNIDFRNTYFENKEEFERYIEESFFEYNIIGNKTLEFQNGIYICKVEISSGYNLSKDTIEKTFIMQLNEGTDFVLSFDI